MDINYIVVPAVIVLVVAVAVFYSLRLLFSAEQKRAFPRSKNDGTRDSLAVCIDIHGCRIIASFQCDSTLLVPLSTSWPYVPRRWSPHSARSVGAEFSSRLRFCVKYSEKAA